jgi:Spy/CpxP family protein refolding chaperone
MGRLFGALMIMAVSVLGAVAATTPAKESASAPAKSHKDARFEKMASELKLTPAQKDQVKTILSAAREQRKTIKASSDSRETAKPKIKVLKEQTNAKLKGVLSPQQYVQYETLKKTRHEHKAAKA